MRGKGKPSLEDDCHNSRPIKEKIRCEVGLHIMPFDVEHNEWECV
jgi:hypothetical protein